MEIINGRLFVAEHFDHFLSVKHFLDEAVHLTQIHLLMDVVLSGHLREIGSDQKHDNGRQDGDHCQRRI